MAAHVCGVLGDPITHSLSPVLHRAAYAALGLDWTYDAHRVPSGGLPAFLAGLDDSWRGLALTMPLKREAVPLLDGLSERAASSGAVNTVVLEDDGGRRRLWGDNTDIPGAVAAVRERFHAPLRRATILGAGATATSVGLALAELGVQQVTLLVRDPSRAQETVEVLEAVAGGPRVVVGSLHAPEESGASDAPGGSGEILVSTIPAAAQSPALVEVARRSEVVFDVVYDPWPTPVAAAAGGVVVSGLDLLVHQALLQFEIFTGLRAPLQPMRLAGEQALAARTAES